MKVKTMFRTFAQMFLGGVVGILLFVGAMHVFADYPEAPDGSSEGGWLGSIFDLSKSDSVQLVVTSGKIGLGKDAPVAKLDVAGEINLNNNLITNVATPVNATDAANKEYVDAAGSSVVINGSTMPTMISKSSSNVMRQGAGALYCNRLSEGGYDDWRLPTFDELSYAVSTLKDTSGSVPSGSDYLWTCTRADYSVTGGSSYDYWLVLDPSNGHWRWNNYNTSTYARCVR